MKQLEGKPAHRPEDVLGQARKERDAEAPAVCVDASLVARLFVGPDDARAWELFDAWTEQEALCAPSLLIYELTDVFYRYHRAGLLDRATLQLLTDAVDALPLTLEPHSSLAEPALRLASTFGLDATYDAYYLALRGATGRRSLDG